MSLQANHLGAHPYIRLWLLVIGLLVYAMILIGGATRLTDSGLSITEWEPLKGAVPPLSPEAWQVLFDKYKTTAEYKLQNAGMSLAEFRYIFWWEWGHRQFGRLIGLVAIGGFVFFAVKKWLTRPLAARLLLLIALGGVQGFIGWWMVASGIGETTRIDVAPYRLMTHFSLALLIIALTAWTWFQLGPAPKHKGQPIQKGAVQFAVLLLVLIGVQMAAGALVAGLDAGRTYTDWPLMAGEVFPSNYIEPGYGGRTLFEGRAATQFNHRFLAYILMAVSLYAWLKYRRAGFALMAGLVWAQAVWGILTLVMAAPIGLALIHQGLGVIILIAAVRLVWLERAMPMAKLQTSLSD